MLTDHSPPVLDVVEQMFYRAPADIAADAGLPVVPSNCCGVSLGARSGARRSGWAESPCGQPVGRACAGVWTARTGPVHSLVHDLWIRWVRRRDPVRLSTHIRRAPTVDRNSLADRSACRTRRPARTSAPWTVRSSPSRVPGPRRPRRRAAVHPRRLRRGRAARDARLAGLALAGTVLTTGRRAVRLPRLRDDGARRPAAGRRGPCAGAPARRRRAVARASALGVVLAAAPPGCGTGRRRGARRPAGRRRRTRSPTCGGRRPGCPGCSSSWPPPACCAGCSTPARRSSVAAAGAVLNAGAVRRARARPRDGHRRLRARHGDHPAGDGRGARRLVVVRGARRAGRAAAARRRPGWPGRSRSGRPAARAHRRPCARRSCWRPGSPPGSAPWRSPRTRSSRRSGACVAFALDALAIAAQALVGHGPRGRRRPGDVTGGPAADARVGGRRRRVLGVVAGGDRPLLAPLFTRRPRRPAARSPRRCWSWPRPSRWPAACSSWTASSSAPGTGGTSPSSGWSRWSSTLPAALAVRAWRAGRHRRAGLVLGRLRRASSCSRAR